MTRDPNRLELGYQDWAEALVGNGFLPFLITFMFHPLGGTAGAKLQQMFAAVEQVYALHITRVLRKPNAPSSTGRRPVWICCPDRPVFKRLKSDLRDVTINDGLHLHVLGFVPSSSRLRGDLPTHFAEHDSLYRASPSPVRRIHVAPITHALHDVVGYARKSIVRGRFALDAILILPRASSEAPGPRSMSPGFQTTPRKQRGVEGCPVRSQSSPQAASYE